MRSYLVVPSVLATLAIAPRVLAAGPTTAECLAATESSLKLHNEHKLRESRRQLLVCASASCPSDVRADCVHGIGEANAEIPTIIFGAKDASGADVSGVKVTMDGEVLTQSLDGTALSIDPGDHGFTFEAPGQSPITKRFTIQQSQKDRREAIAFAAPSAGVSPPVVPLTQPVVMPPVSSEPAPSPLASAPLGTQKILAIVAGGIGVVGIGVGAAFGAIAISKKSSAQSACASNPCSTSDGVSQWSDALTAANVSNVGFIVGGVGLAGGAVLWFTAPKSSGGSTTQVGIGAGALQLKGTW